MQLLLQNKVQAKGVIRPLEPEVYIPGTYPKLLLNTCKLSSLDTCNLDGYWCFLTALDILEAYGIKVVEKVETLGSKEDRSGG